MKDQFDRMESRLQALLEGGLVSILPWGNTRADLIHRLIEAMVANTITTADQSRLAPNIYTIHLNPDRLPAWRTEPATVERLAQHLSRLAEENQIHFLITPSIHLVADPSLSPQEVRVEASIGRPQLGDTAALRPESGESEKTGVKEPTSAFLIVNGNEIFPLDHPVINIGRRLDNHLILSDPRVSRVHAQIRAVRGQYILFDLNSTGGTYVNSQRINRYTLNPGDVISLAGVPLIFGQESFSAEDQKGDQGSLSSGSTRPMLTDHSDRTIRRGEE